VYLALRGTEWLGLWPCVLGLAVRAIEKYSYSQRTFRVTGSLRLALTGFQVPHSKGPVSFLVTLSKVSVLLLSDSFSLSLSRRL
jgi:hypothetical protein